MNMNFLTFIFLAIVFGVMDQLRDLRAQPILRRFIYSYGDTLRTSFTRLL
jgi:hypothetical protein